MVERKNLVFVYGTLLRNHSNWKYILRGRSNYLGEHITEAEYTMLDLVAFPGVIEEGTTSIHGEVFGVSNSIFEVLDRLEGYPHLYTRKQIDTKHGKAWVYLLNDIRGVQYCHTIENGIWK